MFKRSCAPPSPFLLLCLLMAGLLTNSINAQRRQTASTSQAEGLKVLQWRSIGPFRGGRSTAVAGVASQPMVFYFGGTGGGVWKTSDGGINWEPITDGPVFS